MYFLREFLIFLCYNSINYSISTTYFCGFGGFIFECFIFWFFFFSLVFNYVFVCCNLNKKDKHTE